MKTLKNPVLTDFAKTVGGARGNSEYFHFTDTVALTLYLPSSYSLFLLVARGTRSARLIRVAQPIGVEEVRYGNYISKFR
jgi:hypothetical protein